MCFATIHSLSGTAKLYFHTDPEMASHISKCFKRGYYIWCGDVYPTSAITKIEMMWDDKDSEARYRRDLE